MNSFRIAAAGLLIGALSCSRPPEPPSEALRPAEIEAARRLLADRRQPWWTGHAMKDFDPPKFKMADTGDWAAMNYNPPGTPVLPIDLARALHAKAPIFKDTPFADRPVAFFDVRPASDFYVESIPGSRNFPVRELATLPTDLPRKTIVVATGEQYPHHEVIERIRAAGFDAVYCLEGGLKSWKAKSFPLEKRGDVSEYRRLLDTERQPRGDGPSPDFMGLGPLALKSLIDAGADLELLFVGDLATYKAGHIKGAKRVSLDSLEAETKSLAKDRLVAVYCGCCQGRAGGYSEAAARRLRELGFSRVLHLDGHLGAWREAGYPIVSESAK